MSFRRQSPPFFPTPKPKPAMKPTQLLALCGLFATPALLLAQNEPPRPDQPPPPARPAPPEGRRDAPLPDRPRGEARERGPDAAPPNREPGRTGPSDRNPETQAESPAMRHRVQQKRGERAPGPEAERRDARPQHAHKDEPRSRGHSGEMRQVSYLGVLTAPVSPESRAHLGLKEGFGLRVAEVQRGSPAQAAGLKENDVLVRFEDQRLASMEQLQALVRERRKGERVNLGVISAGKEAVVAVEVGETSVPVHRESHGPRFLPPAVRVLPESHFGDMREHMERYRRSLQEWQERMRHWGREPGRGDRPPPPPVPGGAERAPAGPPAERGPAEPRRGESRGVSTVTRSDDSGIYTLKREGDRVIFSAQPKEGEARSWNLHQERDRIPEPLREKLRQLEEIRGDRDEARNRPPVDGRKPENGPRGRD